MPFIWDDQKYLMVSEQEDYNKNRFVIVRKLFVTPIVIPRIKVNDLLLFYFRDA